jgi:hypothetical protein
LAAERLDGRVCRDPDQLYRVEDLRAVPAAVPLLSSEPLRAALGDLNLARIGWVIAGGENGRAYRPVAAEWIRQLRDGCGRQSVPFFIKQWGRRRPGLADCRAAGIPRPPGPEADRRPQGWDLSLSLVRDDLDEADAAVLDRRLPGRGALSSTARLANHGQSGEVQLLHPGLDDDEAVDNPSSEVHHLHPAPGTGCNQGDDEVQLMQPRGAAVAPDPSREPSVEPSAARSHVREALPIDDRGLGGPVVEFFAALATSWRFTAAQRARLAPVVETALNTGWTPTELAAFTGGSTDGVRNPYAVLAARLSSAELPARPMRTARPLWCAGATSGPVCSALTATLRARVPGADLPDAADESASAAPGCPPSAEALDAPAEINEAKDQPTRSLRP